MAKLCPTCQKKTQPPLTHRGTCHAQASSDCKAWTEDFAFTLCQPCSDHLQQCAWCLGPIDGGQGVEVPTNKNFTRVFQKDAGLHVTGMNVGEQVLLQLTIDLYSGYTWQLNRRKSSSEVYLYASRVIRDPQNWRQGTLEMYVDLNTTCEKAAIVFEEVPSSRWSAPSSKTWECTVEIRR